MVVLKDLVPMSFLLSLSGSVMITHTNTHTHTHTGHFDGHAEALGSKSRGITQCSTSRSTYIGSHWTLPSGDYSLRIAPTAAMATINKTTM